jgi:hypothetical protein
VPAATEEELEKEAERVREKNLLDVERIIEIVQGGSSSIAAHARTTDQTQAAATAKLLWNLAKRAERGQVPAHQKQLAQEAAAALTRELVAQPTPSSSAPDTQQESLLAQLSPKDFALSAWSASKLKQKADANVAPLCTAVMQHALQSSILDDIQWMDWSQLLYGLAMSGVRCDESPELQGLFNRALLRLTPTLAEQDLQRSPQSISNLIYAAARAGAAGSKWQEYVAAIAAGYTAGTVMVAASPRDWANTVWACSTLGVYDAAFLSAAAGAILRQIEQATSQDASNTLIASVNLGWYEPAVYDALVHALLHDIRGATPQSVSNVLYACCLAQHVTPAVQKAADAAVASKQQKHWEPQNVSNTLLACAVFALHVRDTSKQTPLLRLPHILFQSASLDNPRRYAVPELCQLWRAHHAAVQRGMPCLSADSRMLAAAQQEAQLNVQQLSKRQPLPFQHAVNSAAAATGRYRVAPPSVREGDFLIQQEVQHKQLGYSLAVLALNQDSYFRHPLGKLMGPVRLRLNRLAEHIPVIVVVLEHEWLALGSDKAAQVAHVDRLLQQAEAAIAAAGVPPKLHSGDGGASQGRADPILIGLPPQEYYCPPEDEQQPADGVISAAPPATLAPGPPQLTPAEAEARLKALQQQALQQQQAFLNGLPSAPASGLNGTKSPTQHQQQPPSPTKPQAPALRPPRRPGA